MTATNLSLSPDRVAPEPGAPPADRVISGAPCFRTWNIDEQPGGLYAGLWEGTPGKWRVQYDEWEYFRILSGVSVLTEEGGAPMRLEAGASRIIRPGFKGTWEVMETTLKEYVIRLWAGAAISRVRTHPISALTI